MTKDRGGQRDGRSGWWRRRAAAWHLPWPGSAGRPAASGGSLAAGDPFAPGGSSGLFASGGSGGPSASGGRQRASGDPSASGAPFAPEGWRGPDAASARPGRAPGSGPAAGPEASGGTTPGAPGAAGDAVAEAMQAAIGLMTASLDSPELERRALPLLVPQDADGLAKLMAGMQLISEIVLRELYEATGEPPEVILNRLALVAERRRGTSSAG